MSITEACAQRTGQPGVEQSYPGILVPRMLEKVETGEMRKEGGYIVECDSIGTEVIGSVVPIAVTVESGCRGAGCPQFVKILEIFFGIRVFLVENDGGLQWRMLNCQKCSS